MRLATLVITALILGAAPVAAQVTPQPKLGDPIGGLTADELARFVAGKALFEQPLGVAEGLGPIFNQTSCASCHNAPASGGAGSISVTRFGFIDGAMNFDPLASLGGSLLQAQSIDGDCIEVVPPEANHSAQRITPPIFGAGLVEAIADADLIDLATNGGNPHMVATLEDPTGPLRVGRFGWKSQVATVLTFSADASLNEMGLTNRFLEEENAPNGDAGALAACDTVADPEDGPDGEGLDFIDRVTDFQRFLAPPPQTPKSGMAGEALFSSIGCAECHVATPYTSGAVAEAALSGVTFKPYSDFLLHDMGGLGDFIEQGDAGLTEIRTTPLWGIRFRSSLLHDGSVLGGTFESRVDAAIGAHAGDAAAAAAAYGALSGADRDRIIAFLGSLGRREFDHDGDNDVDEADFSAFYECFLAGSGVGADDPCAISDIDQNGAVNADDFAAFLTVYEGALDDCDQNGTADIIDLIDGAVGDCNENGVPDSCDIAAGTSADANSNGVPDECDSGGVNVVWCAELGGIVDSCAALTSAFDALGEEYVVIDEITSAGALLASLEEGDVLWCIMGTYPSNQQLTVGEGTILSDLALSGIAVYLEGPDIWGFDPPTPFTDYDGVEDTTVDDGDDTFTQMTGQAFANLDLTDLNAVPYTQDQSGVDWTDRIRPTGFTAGEPIDAGGTNAGTVWRNEPDAGENPYPVAVLYQPEDPFGNVLAQSWEIGGFGGDISVLVQLYLTALREPVVVLPSFIRGDVDGNGAFNGLTDVVYLLAFQFQGGPAPVCPESADADNDANVNGLADGLYILASQFLGGPSPGPPFPLCGTDPDPLSSLGCADNGCP